MTKHEPYKCAANIKIKLINLHAFMNHDRYYKLNKLLNQSEIKLGMRKSY